MREIKQLVTNRRFRRIVLMFFGFFLQYWWLGKIKRFIKKEKMDQKYRETYIEQANKFTRTAMELGGLIIKLGQFVSTRVDILPKEFTDILSRLQDSVAPVPTGDIVSTLEKELSCPVDGLFEDFIHEPIAAASLGQVHKAVLKSGEQVAVKVMRPGIKEIVSLDLSALKLLITFARRSTKISKFVDLEDVYQEFEEVISEELDYRKEAQNAETFRGYFRDFPGVTVPAVFEKFTTRSVLVMEFIDGVKINELDKLDGSKIHLKKLASILYMSYLKQLMEDGFFHADPHPGNLLVKQDGTLAFIDFGMVGRISEDTKNNMIGLALSIYLKDAGGIVEALNDLGFLRKQFEKAALVKNVNVLLSGFSNGKFSLENFQNEEVLEELREFLYQQPFQIPSRTTFLGKAIISVYSICQVLDNHFDIVSLTKPYVEGIMGGKANPVNEKVLDQIKDSVLKVIPAVRKAAHVMEQMESGEIKVAIPRTFEMKWAEQQDRQTRKIVVAIFGTGLLLSGSQIFTHNNQAGISLMIIGGIITLLQAVKGGNGRIHRRRRHPF